MYNILDFKAGVKHAYYGCKDSEAITCDVTGRQFATWKAGVNDWLSRFIIPILDQDGNFHNLITAHDMGRDYRSAVFPGYKVKPEKQASEVESAQLEKMMNWCKSFLTAVGSTQIGVKGVEADDVIAWLCQRISGPKTVYTVDGDLIQLVNDQTLVYLKHEPYFGEGEYQGIPYHLTSLAKSITGDSSDCYPGIKGMGAAKITHLLETFGVDGMEQLQEIVDTGNHALLDEAIEQSADKVLVKLREEFSTWRTMWRLAKLNPDLCWKPRAKKLVKPDIYKRLANPDRVSHLLTQVGAEDWWETHIAACMPTRIAITSENWEEYRDAIFEEIAAGDITAFDYETTDREPIEAFRVASASGDNFVDVLSATLTGASFCFGAHRENVVYIPVNHKDSPNLPKSVVAEILEAASQKTQLVAQNAFFEGVVSQTNLGLKLRDVHDTRIMQRYFDENADAGLKSMSLQYLGCEQVSYKDTLAAGNNGEGVANMEELTLDEAFSYGAEDGQVTAALWDLLKLLLQLDQQWEFYQQWAVNPTAVLQHSYINGVDINWDLQKQLHQRDLVTVEEGMVELRQILADGVSGEITEGCLSFIEAEKEYIFRAAKRKAENAGDKDPKATAGSVLYDWQTKLEKACQYTPQRVEVVMPKFAMTPKQLTAASENVGLNPVERVSQSYILEYLGDYGIVGFDPEWPEDVAQREFLQCLYRGLNEGAFSVKSLEGKLTKATETGDERKIAAASEALDRATQGFEEFGEEIQRLAGVTPKEISSGDELNVGSPVQMQQLLYCKIGVPVRLHGKQAGKGRLSVGIKKAGPSTDETAILTAIANDIERDSWRHKALEALLKVKSASTRISLYHTTYPLWKHRDGKIHPSVTDAGTDTRRPTASAPNILQVSKKDKAMRSQFIPPSRDHVVVAIDYASQEIRLMACEAKDPVMISVYDPANEKDLHSMTGSGIGKMDYDSFIEALNDEGHELNKITNGLRKKAKGVNFGLAYGAGAMTLSRNLIVTIEEADKLLTGTMGLYARIPKWQEETAKFMERNGFTLTAFGTKRHANDDIFSKDYGKVSRQHRQGTNATIQGTAAEMLRIVLTKMVDDGMLDRLNMVFFAPIYDEVVAFVHKDDVVEYCTLMNDIMRSATPPGHVVPQVPEFSIGPDWGRVHELGRWPGADAIKEAVERSLEEAVEMWDQMEKAA